MTNEKKTLQDWLNHARTLHTQSIDLGFERIKPMAKRLGLLDPKYTVITVGGTNGKGSCVTLLESIYLAAGYRVCTITSPELFSFNERLRINGKNIDDKTLCQTFAIIEKIRQATPLTFFEYIILASLHIIQAEQPDVAILEVGLGGRLDAVNIIDPDLAMITSVDLDHTDRLGNTREEIGFEKAGIMRANKPFVCGDSNPPDSILARARQLNAPSFYGHCCINRPLFCDVNPVPSSRGLTAGFIHSPSSRRKPGSKRNSVALARLARLDSGFRRNDEQFMQQRCLYAAYDFHCKNMGDTWQWRCQDIQLDELPKPRIALQNASTVLTAIHALQQDLPVSLNAIKKGLQNVHIPGRFQLIPGEITHIVDVAHNPASAKLLADNFTQFSPQGKVHAIFAVLKDKDIAGTLKPMLQYVDHWHLAGIDEIDRGTPADVLEKHAQAIKCENYTRHPNLTAAHAAAFSSAKAGDVIIAFGSFYVAGWVLKKLSYRA